MTAYATRLCNHLAESRRNRLPFERAYKAAEAELEPETDYPLAATKRIWEAGYHRRGRKGGGLASLLMDQDRLYIDHVYSAPEFTGVKRCGYGDGCNELRTPRMVLLDTLTYKAKGARKASVTVRVHGVRMGGLCDEHRVEILAAFARAQYRSPAEDHMEQTAAIREREAA